MSLPTNHTILHVQCQNFNRSSNYFYVHTSFVINCPLAKGWVIPAQVRHVRRFGILSVFFETELRNSFSQSHHGWASDCSIHINWAKVVEPIFEKKIRYLGCLFLKISVLIFKKYDQDKHTNLLSLIIDMALLLKPLKSYSELASFSFS